MARPLRIEFQGAVYHVTSRGDRRESIFADDEDRLSFLAVVEQALSRFDAHMLAYCLMGNHYHFVLRTHQANLSRLMRHVNGVYTQAFNRRHGKVGHLLQGRYNAILVDRDAYLLEVCRYVELNPVRARSVDAPEGWPWSSHRAHVGASDAPAWLDIEELHGCLLGRRAVTAGDHRRAVRRYAEWVASAVDVPLWRDALRQQIYLGDEEFVERMQALADPDRRCAKEIPRVQRRNRKSVSQWLACCPSREEAFYKAYTEGGLSMTVIAAETGLSVSRISRLIGTMEKAKRKT